MALAENISERLSVKYYASATISSNTKPVPSSEPGASGAQQKRFVSHNLSLTKADIPNNEKRTDRQQPLGRQGTERVEGSIQGILSPLTYETEFEAAFRGAWAAQFAALNESDLTSVAADNATSKFTFAAGDPVSLGMRKGMVIRFADLSEAANNGKNFLITGFGGTSNREVTVYPAPDDMSADTDFTITPPGARLVIPSSSHTSYKLAVESYQQDIDVAELFTECRIGGFNLGANADQNTTVEFMVMGRGRQFFTGTNAPFFTSPTAQTSTEICGPVGGLIRANGENQGVVTAFSLSMNLNGQGPSVLAQDFVPEIFLQQAAGTGNISFFYEDADLIQTFDNETRIEIFLLYASSQDDDADLIAFYLPYAQLGSVSKTDDGSGGKLCSAPFSFGPYSGTAPAGVDVSMIQMVDTTVTP